MSNFMQLGIQISTQRMKTNAQDAHVILTPALSLPPYRKAKKRQTWPVFLLQKVRLYYRAGA